MFYGRLLPPTNEEQIRLGQQVVGVKKLKSNVKTITQKNGLKGNVENLRVLIVVHEWSI